MKGNASFAAVAADPVFGQGFLAATTPPAAEVVTPKPSMPCEQDCERPQWRRAPQHLCQGGEISPAPMCWSPQSESPPRAAALPKSPSGGRDFEPAAVWEKVTAGAELDGDV